MPVKAGCPQTTEGQPSRLLLIRQGSFKAIGVGVSSFLGYVRLISPKLFYKLQEFVEPCGSRNTWRLEPVLFGLGPGGVFHCLKLQLFSGPCRLRLMGQSNGR